VSRVATNSAWQLVSFAARAISGVGTVVLVARTGGPAALGAFQFALMLTAFLPYYFGLPSLLAREVARHPDEARRWVEAGTLIALAAGSFFSVLFAVGAYAVGASPETAAAVSVAGIAMAFDGVARVQFAALWAWERMRLEALVTAAQEAAFIAGVVIVVWSGGGVIGALLAFCGSRAMGAAAGWLLVGRLLGALPIPRGDAIFLRSTLRRSAPFAVNDTLTLTYTRADAVLLGFMKGPAAVGLYQAGTNLVLNLNVLARSINRAVYPRMSRAWPSQAQAFCRLRDCSYRAIALIAMPAAVGSFLLAPQTFDFLYGNEFDRGVVTYQLLVLVIPIRMLGNTLSLSLVATDRQKQRMVAVATAAALNLALNVVLIPKWSYLGAGIATVICESGLLVVYAVLLRRVAGRSDLLRSLSLPTAAVVPMGAVLLATRSEGLLTSAAAGAAVYAVGVAAIAVARTPRATRRRPSSVMSSLVRPTP
jgi:O-antigen/teichoic acid export membrane protein